MKRGSDLPRKSRVCTGSGELRSSKVDIDTNLPCLKKNIAPENRKDAQKESSPQITIFQGPKMLGF